MTDRLFLKELVREIAPAIRGSRVRSLRADPSGCVSLFLSRDTVRVLVFHLDRSFAGLYWRAPENEPRKSSPRETKLTKWLSPSVVESVDASEIDRVVTVQLQQTRLSGRKKTIALVLEVVATRASLFVVDRETGRIVDCFSKGATRCMPPPTK